MKQALLTLLFATAFAATASAQTFRASPIVGGSQYVVAPAGRTVIVAPEFQRPSVATFRVTAASTASGLTTLTLTGRPPLDSYGAPLLTNQYQAAADTYYAMVTAGDWMGMFFTVTANTATTLEIQTDSLPNSTAKSVRAIEIRPYWSLETLFPASVADVSFIPTTDPMAIKTQIVLSPVITTATEQPQAIGEAFYFNSTASAWVSATDPSTDNGKTLVAPGRYLYWQNTSAGSYPLDVVIAGTVLTAPFRQNLFSAADDTTITYFALPRSSPYKLSQLGLTDINFTPSLSQGLLGRNDVLVVDDGFGNAGAIYYRYLKKWYVVGSALPVDPVFPAGTAYGVLKKANSSPVKVLINLNNIR
jgi:uncharacterized protein (TIGR02597 family)